MSVFSRCAQRRLQEPAVPVSASAETSARPDETKKQLHSIILWDHLCMLQRPSGVFGCSSKYNWGVHGTLMHGSKLHSKRPCADKALTLTLRGCEDVSFLEYKCGNKVGKEKKFVIPAGVVCFQWLYCLIVSCLCHMHTGQVIFFLC